MQFSKRNRRKRKREVCAPRAESVIHSWKFCKKFGRRRRNFLCEYDAGRARFRQRTRHRLDATFLRRQKIFTAMPAEVVEHCASTCRKFENEFAHFLAEKLRNLRAERALFQRSTACRPALELRRRLAICKTESSAKNTLSLRAARRKRGPFVPISWKGNVSLIKKVTQEFLKKEGGSEGFV